MGSGYGGLDILLNLNILLCLYRFCCREFGSRFFVHSSNGIVYSIRGVSSFNSSLGRIDRYTSERNPSRSTLKLEDRSLGVAMS